MCIRFLSDKSSKLTCISPAEDTDLVVMATTRDLVPVVTPQSIVNITGHTFLSGQTKGSLASCYSAVNLANFLAKAILGFQIINQLEVSRVQGGRGCVGVQPRGPATLFEGWGLDWRTDGRNYQMTNEKWSNNSGICQTVYYFFHSF